MTKKSKLKDTQRWMTLFTAILLGIILIAWLLFDEPGFYWAFGSIQGIMAVIHLITLIRTRNIFYLFPALFYLFVALTFIPPLYDSPGHLIFALAAGVALIGFFIVLVRKKLNWRYREVLEIASLRIDEASNGFTSRPFPSGTSDHSREEAVGMAGFLLKNVVAYPFIESDRVVYVIPRYMWLFLMLFKRNYEKDTYIAFYNTGEVTVRIDRRDYLAFKEKLTFDQLCLALGELFKQFMRHYRKGEAEKIMEKL